MAQSPTVQTLLDQSHWIQRLAARLVGDPHVAEDLAQDAWVTALEHQPDPGRPLGAWVSTVLRHNLAKLRRRDANRERRERALEAEAEAPSTLDVVERAATHRNLVEAVLALDEPYRTTILLRFFEQRSYREIAKAMEVTTATVNSRMTRGLERLRQRLDHEYGGDRKSWALALLPLAKTAAGVPLSTSGVSIMTTSLLVGVLSLAAATTYVVWDPAGEPTAPLAAPSAPLGLGMAEPEPATPQLRPALPPAAVAIPRDEPVAAARSAVAVPTLDGAAARGDEWTTEFFHTHAQLETTESVALNTASGNIEVVASRDGNVGFDAKVVADLDRVEPAELSYALEDHVTITEEEGTLTIESAHKGRGARGWQVNFVLYVPEELALRANTGSGDVTVREVGSDAMVNTGSGDVSITGSVVAEKLLANTGSGDVHIDVGGASGALVANTGSGDVHAVVRHYDPVGKLSLNSGSGDLTLGVHPNVTGEFELETHAGEIRIPDSLGLIVEEDDEGRFVRGTVGSGGGRFQLSSGSGDIVVHTNTGTADPN